MQHILLLLVRSFIHDLHGLHSFYRSFLWPVKVRWFTPYINAQFGSDISTLQTLLSKIFYFGQELETFYTIVRRVTKFTDKIWSAAQCRRTTIEGSKKVHKCIMLVCIALHYFCKTFTSDGMKSHLSK